jgi:16S rRNA C967 or C1407 C5-methylase (RsmB/RsmF family)/NOL1/NOP2/fmu family ribosome biogenesis protein
MNTSTTRNTIIHRYVLFLQRNNYSMPAFPLIFETRMRNTLKEEWNSFRDAHDQPSPVSIRVNPNKPHDFQGLPTVPWCSTGRYLSERPIFTLDPTFHGGAYYVQEASSMLLEQALLPILKEKGTVTVLDLCAAPGGKSTHIASLISEDSLLISNEVIRSRASILAENIQKWGNHNVVVTNNDPSHFSELKGVFDIIVVDAPCSGEGLFRKDPNAMQEWSEDNVQLCSQRQQRILHDIWPALKENGILVYSTCTYNASENDENLQWLRTQHDCHFESIPVDPTWGIAIKESNQTIGYQCYPHRVQGEGFFMSVIRKQEPSSSIRIKSSKQGFNTPSKIIVEKITPWIHANVPITFIQREELIQFFPTQYTDVISLLTKHLRLITAGTFLGTVKHNKVIPDHALALSQHLASEIFSRAELSEKEALQYLRKENLDVEQRSKGFTLMQHKGVALGWANVLDNRINNLYPSEWRIRMGDRESS